VAQVNVAGYSLGARVALELATRGRTLSVIAIAPDGLGTPLERVHQAAMLDIPTGLGRITCPVLLLQGTADPLVSMQSPRFLAFIRNAQMQWLPGLSHVPISDDPELVASLMLRFLKTATEKRNHGRRLPARRRSRVS
jgi:pimeloyl-ACP methyl ester carboxylesterase